MRTPLASFRIIRPLLLGTLIAVVLAFVIFASSSPFYFEVTIQSSLSSAAQVYYDIGHGIREADSVRRPITGGNAALRYRFPLPNGTYRGLRFDPSDLGGASITIRNALIVDRNGANQPVKDLSSGKVAITAQNHGFALDPESLPSNVEVTHINLNDGTVEGMRHKELPIFSVQYHPEAAPGPHDASYFFDQFADLIEKSV